ncbi:MAG: hypothetical protein SGBAC_006156 [Bacillariaceae sp.]
MGTRLDSPTLYQWDLDENSTRYEYPRARPEDNVLQIQFSILAFINAVVAVSSLVLIIAILKSKQVRSSAFNLYLLFMAIPDFIGSFLCLLTCAMSAPGSDYYSEAMCGFQGFYLVFAFCGNAWINAVIVHEVNKLLNYSQKRRRYFPPTRRRVLCHVAAVYTYAAFWGLLTAFPILGMPFQTKAYYGFACFPMEQDTASTWFFYFAFLPGILMIPMLYSVFVMGRIILKGLLPTAGKRRALSLFLMRLIVVYFLGWLPFMIFSFIGNFFDLGPWWFWGSAVISHFQGFVSSIVVYKTSETIKREMQSIICCDCRREDVSEEWDQEDPERISMSKFIRFSRSSNTRSMSMKSLNSGKSHSEADSSQPNSGPKSAMRSMRSFFLSNCPSTTNNGNKLDNGDSKGALRATESGDLLDQTSSTGKGVIDQPSPGVDKQTDLEEEGESQEEDADH